MRPFISGLLATAAALAGCASAHGPLQRALDPSMERVLETENYVRAVAGITGDATRLRRGDGVVYLVDVAPSMRHLAMLGDTASYRRLLRYVESTMITRDSAGAHASRRVRGREAFEAAAPFTVRRLGDALALAWQQFGDTASAMLASRLHLPEPAGAGGSSTDRLVERCTAAEASTAANPAAARRILAEAKSYRGGGSAAQASSLDFRGSDGGLVALSCLTRLGLAVKDPDATVRFLDRMLDEIGPLRSGSGRPDPGAAAEVLLTLSEVRAAGPGYFTAP